MVKTRGVNSLQGVELEGRKLAHIYTNLGWYLTPLRGKAPYLKNWPDTASNRKSTIANWVTQARNVGLVTGKRSGVVVLDVDPRNGGNEALETLIDRVGPLPSTLTCNTGGGGQHYYFQYWDGATSGKPLPGLDFQCDRRCVVLPPSVHPDTGAGYDWLTSPALGGIAELPVAWKQALCKPASQSMPVGDLVRGPILEGQRNSVLFALAVSLAKGGISESQVRRVVAEENAVRCAIPLNPEELDKIVRSSLQYRQTSQSTLTRFQQSVGYAELPTARKATLWALSLFADKHGRNCYPTIDQIAERSGLARETAGKHLARAESEGWILRVSHPRAVGPGFNYSYILQIPDNLFI